MLRKTAQSVCFSLPSCCPLSAGAEPADQLILLAHFAPQTQLLLRILLAPEEQSELSHLLFLALGVVADLCLSQLTHLLALALEELVDLSHVLQVLPSDHLQLHNTERGAQNPDSD